MLAPTARVLVAAIACCGGLSGMGGTARAAAEATQVATGSSHSCALLSDRSVQCWGWNKYGQLGDGTIIDRTKPIAVGGVNGATQIASSGSHSCALVAGGAARCWGWNPWGQLGDGTATDRSTAVSVETVSGAIQIATGYGHTCVLLSGGSVKCWGHNEFGQLGDGTTADRKAPVSVLGVAGATQISTGWAYSCALLSGGSVKCWGANGSGQLGNGKTADSTSAVLVPRLTGVTQITTGDKHACALLSGGTVRCWGGNYGGQLGDGTSVDRRAPVVVSVVTGATQVTAGWGHSCALLSSKSVMCWGSNYGGQLGDGTTFERERPQVVGGVSGATQVSAGWGHSCALLSGGSLKCWGWNSYGKLGDGTRTNRYSPVSVEGLLNLPAAPTASMVPPPMTRTDSTIQFTGPVGATFMCSLDGAGESPCSSPLMLSGLADGPHSVAIRSVASGFDGPSGPTTVSWILDTVEPAAPLLLGKPSRFSNSVSPSFAFMGEAGGTYSCALGAEAVDFSPCSSGAQLARLSEGDYVFSVKQSDPAGNIGPAASWSWTVDRTAPTLKRSAVIGRTKSSTQTSYQLDPNQDVSGIARVEYSTAARAPAQTAANVPARTVPYATPVVFRTGATIKWIRLQDGAGNWSPWLAG